VNPDKIRSLKFVSSLFILCLSFFLSSNLAFHQNLWDGGSCFAEERGDALVVAASADVRNLVPILAADSASAGVCSFIFNGLVKYDKNIEIVPDLAQSWEILQDGRVIVFHLRQDVLWHDGHPFSAEDVAFTYEKLIDPDVRTPYSEDFKMIESLEVLDPYTVKVTYRKLFSPALASWGMWIMPKHLLEKEDLNATGFSRHPIGTGPYRFLRWRSQERIDLVYNPAYFEGRPFIDRYVVRVIPDETTTFLELSTEGVDETELSPLQFRRLTDTTFFRTHYRKFSYPSFGYTYLGYNLAHSLFKDPRVRRALNLAVDKNELIKIVLLGLGRVCTGPFVPESWAWNPEVTPEPYNPPQARRLLAQAGWQDTDGDGWLDKAGQVFRFTIITNQGNPQRKTAAEIIQRRLAQIGIQVKIKIVEWSAFLSEFIEKRHFEAILLGWSLGRDPDCFDIWHSSKTREGEFNFIGYSNPEVDRLLEEARQTFDRAKRQACYFRIHQILYEEQPYMFLYIPDALPIIHARIRNVEVGPIGIGYNFVKWWVARDEQKYTRWQP
jgi:peptide/nickel transport system substrate-binding protein